MLDRGEAIQLPEDIPIESFDSFYGQPFFPDWQHKLDGYQTRSDGRSTIYGFYRGTWRFVVDLAVGKVELTSSLNAMRPTFLTDVVKVKINHQDGEITFIARDRKDWKISEGGIRHDYKGKEPFYLPIS